MTFCRPLSDCLAKGTPPDSIPHLTTPNITLAIGLTALPIASTIDITPPAVLTFSTSGVYTGHSSWTSRGDSVKGNRSDFPDYVEVEIQNMGYPTSDVHDDVGFLQLFGSSPQCIPFVVVGNNEADLLGLWSGAIGEVCGKEWYYSDVLHHEEMPPRCTWTHGAMQIKMMQVPDESNKEMDYPKHCDPETLVLGSKSPYDLSQSAPNNASLVDDRRFGPYTRFKRPHRPATFPEHDVFRELVVSRYKEHSAIDLCESPTSRGPDFVSLSEDMFCDMSNKQLSPLCLTGEHHGGCFSLEEILFVDRPIPYNDVIYWGLPKPHPEIKVHEDEVSQHDGKTASSIKSRGEETRKSVCEALIGPLNCHWIGE